MATAPNPNWNRWIMQSIIDHYVTNVVTPNTIPFIVDGIDVRDETFLNEPDRAELRVTGPDTKELSAGCWRLWVTINIFLTSAIGQEGKNRYDLETLVGQFLEFTDGPISIDRLGTGVDDDSSHLGCLLPRKELQNAVRSIYFGQINPDDLIKQAQIDGRFEMIIQV